ncbi:MAG: TrmH family RNA methyltransferase [Ignavibacteria bacterium]
MPSVHRLPKYDIRTVRKLTYDELVTVRASVEEAAAIPRHPLALVVHDIRSLYNVGSLFRTSDAFAVAKVVLCGFTPAPPRPEIAKTALGADATVPFVWFATITEALEHLRSEGYHLWAAEITTGSIGTEALTIENFPLALILGNELTGVPNDVLDQCEGSLEIPMFGTKHSLNVAVAAGILLSSIVDRYRKLV